MEDNFEMLAKTLYGLEPTLAKELKNLGAMGVSVANRLVRFTGDKGFMYKANLCLRTAIKILKPLHEFRAVNDKALYDSIYHYDWNTILTVDSTFAIA